MDGGTGGVLEKAASVLFPALFGFVNAARTEKPQSAARAAPPRRRQRIVIVGAGFAGLTAALGLRRADADVTIIDRHNRHDFQPLLYQVATAMLPPEDIAMPIRGLFRGCRHISVRMDEATSIDRKRRQIHTHRGPLDYDTAVIATGAASNFFGHEEWQQHVLPLKTLDDALRMRHSILYAFELAEMTESEEERRNLCTFVIVGGGPTGVELAGAVSELSGHLLGREYHNLRPEHTRVILIEAAPRLLGGFPEELARYAQQSLERKGVSVWLNSPVERVRPGTVITETQSVRAGSILWAPGVQTRGAAAWLDAEEHKGRVVVAPNLTLPDDPNVFVVGDIAAALGRDGEPLPALAAVAQQQGRFVARVILARLAGKPPPDRFRYRDRGILATIGHNAAVAAFPRARLRGRFAWIVWGLVHIYFLVSFRNRTMVFLHWAWQFFTLRRGARVITKS